VRPRPPRFRRHPVRPPRNGSRSKAGRDRPCLGTRHGFGRPATPPEEKKDKKGGVPWWKRPGPIVGMVLGGVAIGALALSGGGGGDNNPPASASLPSE
jgi:hypothetical protein